MCERAPGLGMGPRDARRALVTPDTDRPNETSDGSRMMGERSPLSAVVKGAIAGAIGTLCMDLLWYRRYQQGGGTEEFVDWEFSTGTDSYENAGAPAQVGRRVLEGYLGRDLKPSSAAFMNNLVHWMTGVGWGTLYGVVAGSAATPKVGYGPALGTVAWAGAYTLLSPAGIYQPMWEYDARTLGRDLSAHLVFGVGTSVAFRALTVR